MVVFTVNLFHEALTATAAVKYIGLIKIVIIYNIIYETNFLFGGSRNHIGTLQYYDTPR